ncbi:MAG TPA: c-type cytochrome [Candidatus Limnocylindria bacterium]|nr:c-type cytochrome [Candidatus Limnocylindria bacterium]
MTIHTPIETRGSGIPAWVIGLTVFVLLVGGVYLASNLAGDNPAFAIPGASAPAPEGSAGADPAVGEQLVGTVTPPCTACHGADLSGSGNFPNLHGVADGPVVENLQQLATDYPDTWIHLWIDGTGPEVEGIDRGGMPAFGEQLSPDQIDSIVAYLKSL